MMEMSSLLAALKASIQLRGYMTVAIKSVRLLSSSQRLEEAFPLVDTSETVSTTANTSALVTLGLFSITQ